MVRKRPPTSAASAAAHSTKKEHHATTPTHDKQHRSVESSRSVRERRLQLLLDPLLFSDDDDDARDDIEEDNSSIESSENDSRSQSSGSRSHSSGSRSHSSGTNTGSSDSSSNYSSNSSNSYSSTSGSSSGSSISITSIAQSIRSNISKTISIISSTSGAKTKQKSLPALLTFGSSSFDGPDLDILPLANLPYYHPLSPEHMQVKAMEMIDSQIFCEDTDSAGNTEDDGGSTDDDGKPRPVLSSHKAPTAQQHKLNERETVILDLERQQQQQPAHWDLCKGRARPGTFDCCTHPAVEAGHDETTFLLGRPTTSNYQANDSPACNWINTMCKSLCFCLGQSLKIALVFLFLGVVALTNWNTGSAYPSVNRLQSIFECVSHMSGETNHALRDADSPQSAAVDWLFANRHHGGTTAKDDCGPAFRTIYGMIVLRESLHFNASSDNQVGSWYTVQNKGVCDWSGVTCDNHDAVIGLSGKNTKLRGTIPPEVATLKDLTHLDLASQTGLSGSLPASLAKMTTLTSIKLDHTSLTGSLPSGLGLLTSLQELLLDGTAMTGDVPTEVCQLSSLHNLLLPHGMECSCCDKVGKYF